ncbi:hypothetical protein IPL68_04395 [Candidatus Saccharibacteria bacterium]|nr:MAG: hypothetical protein IPL68_04395 [Candidatus Saccharibacteria bacterium]
MPFTGTGTGIQNANDVFFSNPSDGQTIQYNSATAKWNNVVGTSDPALGGDLTGTASNAQIAANAVGSTEITNSAVGTTELADGSVTEPKLSISNSPASNQVLSWDGTDMTWATPSAGVDDGTRLLDSFAGADDDAKLTAAITWQQGHSRMPAIRLGSRLHTFNQTRQLYSGLKLIGTPAGPRNLEQSGGVFVPTRINLGAAISSGTSSWWVTPGGNLFDIYMADFAVAGDGGVSKHQFIDVTTGSLYACQFHALSFNMMRSVFGRKDRKCLITQTLFTGHWTANNLWDTQFMLGGADNNLWMDGYLNIGPSSSPAQTGTYADNDYELILIRSVRPMSVLSLCPLSTVGEVSRCPVVPAMAYAFGGAYEGYKSSNDNLAAPGTVIRPEGGNGAFFSPSIGQGMQSPDVAESGLVHITGGEWAFYSPTFYRTPAADTVPMIYASGGRVLVEGATRNDAQEAWTTRPKYLLGGPMVTGPSSGENVFYCPDMSMVP